MKRAVLVSACAGVVALTAVLIHVIPYKLSVRELESSFSSAQKTCAELEAPAAMPNSMTEAARHVETVVSAVEIERQLEADLGEVESRSSGIRRWIVSVEIGRDDIAHLRECRMRAIALIPQVVGTAIAEHSQGAATMIRRASDPAQLRETLVGFRASTQELARSLGAASAELRDLDDTGGGDGAEVTADLIIDHRSELGTVGNAALEVVADRVKADTGSALARIESANSVKAVVEAANTAATRVQEWNKVALLANELSSDPALTRKALAACNEQLGIIQGEIALTQRVTSSMKRAHERMSQALEVMDTANRELQGMERFASAAAVGAVYQSWERAEGAVNMALSTLEIPVYSEHERVVSSNLTAGARRNMGQIQRKVQEHREMVGREYTKARQEESTSVGKVGRDVRRTADRVGNWLKQKTGEASNSRIGRELGLSAKVLILGTKMFYDLMDPNADPVSWAFAYSGDLEQLMNETEAVSSMPGPSLMDSQTIFEELVNQAYSEAFSGGRP